MYRRTMSFRTLAEIEEKSEKEHQELIAKLNAKAEADRKEATKTLAEAFKWAEERLAADNKRAEERLATDRKEAEARQRATEERLATDRKEAEARQRATEERLAQERKDWDSVRRTQTRWLVATFVTVFIGVAGFFVALLGANGYLPF